MNRTIYIVQGIARHFSGDCEKSTIGVAPEPKGAERIGAEWVKRKTEQFKAEGRNIHASYQIDTRMLKMDVITQKEVQDRAELEKYDGKSGKLLEIRKCVLNRDELIEALRTLWPLHIEIIKTGGVGFRVYDSEEQMLAEEAPVYEFFVRSI